MITPKEMLRLENESNIPVKELMDNAGRGVYGEIKKKIDLINKKVVIVCSQGNNGGDGFAAAVYLKKECDVKIIFLGKEEKLSEEARFYYEQVKDLIVDDFSDCDVLIDAMLGTGVKGGIREPMRSMIDRFNNSKAFKVSIDIPTGLNPENGKILDKIINADLIIALHDIKPGLDKFINKVVIVDIGLGGENG